VGEENKEEFPSPVYGRRVRGESLK